MEMEESKKNGVMNEKCFICEEEATDTCRFCTSGIAYCGDGHMEIHRKNVSVYCNVRNIMFI